jgi:hypothetical protein
MRGGLKRNLLAYLDLSSSNLSPEGINFSLFTTLRDTINNADNLKNTTLPIYKFRRRNDTIFFFV